MCMFKTPKMPAAQKLIKAPPPPKASPSEIENAVDSNANLLSKKKKGTKGAFGKKLLGAQYSGQGSGSGLTINKV